MAQVLRASGVSIPETGLPEPPSSMHSGDSKVLIAMLGGGFGSQATGAAKTKLLQSKGIPSSCERKHSCE